jgi:putative oxidoreductase
MDKLAKYSDQAYALLRIVSGFMFTFHGVQKILGLLTERIVEFGSQMWIGGLVELLGGLFIMIGFQTRWAAFIASGTMAVAYIQFHWKFQFGEMLLPIMNRGETAALYCFVFLLIASRGAVMWAVDKN